MKWTSKPDFEIGQWWLWKRLGESGVFKVFSGWSPDKGVLYYGPIPEPVESEPEPEKVDRLNRAERCVEKSMYQSDSGYMKGSMRSLQMALREIIDHLRERES